MKEKFGLSLLADTATELAGGRGHYPVRRRGEVRRLDPNWAGIAWLEARSLDDTHPQESYGYASESNMAGLIKTVYVGRWLASQRNNYPRPMFEVFGLTSSSTLGARNQAPCPACDDFAYTARCRIHPDKAPPPPRRRPTRSPVWRTGMVSGGDSAPTVDVSFNSAGTMVISTWGEVPDDDDFPF